MRCPKGWFLWALHGCVCRDNPDILLQAFLLSSMEESVKVSLWVFSLLTGTCALWVFQPPEIHSQEGATAFLPCSFNATQGTQAIGTFMWYRDKVARGKEVMNRTPEFRGRLAPFAISRFLHDHQAELTIWNSRDNDSGVYVCWVEVLGLGIGTGQGTLLVVEKGETS